MYHEEMVTLISSAASGYKLGTPAMPKKKKRTIIRRICPRRLSASLHFSLQLKTMLRSFLVQDPVP